MTDCVCVNENKFEESHLKKINEIGKKKKEQKDLNTGAWYVTEKLESSWWDLEKMGKKKLCMC